MWSEWGIRTLAADEPAYDPTSYHCGSVWPHDNALCAAGLARYGCLPEAHQVIRGMVQASSFWDGRLPELFCGVDRSDIPSPVPYPTSCSPQAWAAASPLLFLRVVLGMDPDLPNGRCSFRPSLPEGASSLSVRGLRLWGSRIDVSVDRAGIEVDGLPAGITLDT
jgi:glycogen debranching enzyme